MEDRKELIYCLHWLLKMDSDVERANSWLEQLRNWAGVGREGRRDNLPIDLCQLRKLGQSEYITIGAHTVNHRSLGAQTKEGQCYEIRASVCFLKKMLGREILTFSYPFGSAVHFNQDTFEICGRNGVIKAAATVKGVWRKYVNLYAIPRVEVKDMGGKEFTQFLEKCWRFG